MKENIPIVYMVMLYYGSKWVLTGRHPVYNMNGHLIDCRLSSLRVVAQFNR